MSCHLFKSRKIILFVILILSFLGSIIFFAKDNFLYDKLSRQIFRDELSGNSLTLHYTLMEPKKYGIKSDEASLPVYTRENQLASVKSCTESLRQLSNINYDKLSKSRQYDFILTKRFFTLQDKLNQFPYYNEPCSPGSGMQTTLPILFSEYRFYNKQDIYDYLSLLSQIDEYFESLAVFETEKEAAGLFMSDDSADEVIAECKSYAALSNYPDTHFLVCSFENRLEKWCAQNPDKLSSEEVSSLCSQNREIITQQLSEGYLTLADTFQKLKGKKPFSQGLGITDEGKEYYTLLLRKNTGSYRSMEAIEQLLFQQFDSLCQTIQTLNPTADMATATTPHLTAEEMLLHLQQDMVSDYPMLPNEKSSDISQPSCDIKYVDDALANYSAPAFYLVPPIDDCNENTIYINPQNKQSGLSLFTTLAHEGFPGHLYQTVYAHRSGFASPQNPLRGILNYEGYCEGWALYVELESYRYAGKYYPINTELQQAVRSLDLCLCGLLDFQIHYRNMSKEHVISFLGSLGISKENAVSLFQYVVNEPTTYLKYYLSYLEICSLKDAAKEKWGNDYSDYRFHKYYLDAGPSDFSTLREHL